EKLGRFPEYHLFHFGDYETKALRRIRGRLSGEQQEQVDRGLGRAVNVLSIVHPHVYFPTYSCGLKDIGRSIGSAGSDPEASGSQNVIWRARWDMSREEALKDKLIRYNAEDCAALKAIVDLLRQIAPGGSWVPVGSASPAVVHTDDLHQVSHRRHRF